MVRNLYTSFFIFLFIDHLLNFNSAAITVRTVYIKSFNNNTKGQNEYKKNTKYSIGLYQLCS